MKTKCVWIVAALMLIVVQMAVADGLSIQLKRTNPGIVSVKSAELIFDIVNTDFGYQIEGFLLCRSPDDVTVSSTLGAGSGSGAQYISPKFELNNGPSQKYLSLVIDSEVEGDMRTGCILKYIPFSEKAGASYFDEATNQTITTSTRQYVRMDGQIIEKPLDKDYRELRLDKTVPFVAKQKGVDASCPEGQTSCNANEVIINKNWFMYGFIALVIIGVVLLVVVASRRSAAV